MLLDEPNIYTYRDRNQQRHSVTNTTAQ